MSQCSNCNSGNTTKLNDTGANKIAPMSDGKVVKNFEAAHFLCKDCACIFTEYYPKDRLERFFKEEYDVSDTVQNCQVVLSGAKHNKHSVIHKNLLNEVENLASSGNMLEIACGQGDLTRLFSQKYPQWKSIGLDPSLNATFEPNDNLEYIRDFFSPNIFKETKFDVIVAHGILNRTPTLTMLQGICDIANHDALVSIEIVTLENSFYAPYIWDHSYTFLEDTFKKYLNNLGLIIKNTYDCGSTIQFICKYDATKKKVFTTSQLIVQTQDLYDNHISKWSSIKNNFENYSKEYENNTKAIFGAGLYSAVLSSVINPKEVDLVIDELRAGREFQEYKVKDIKDIDNKETVFLLCARERNMDFLNSKLTELSFKVKNLF